MKHDIDSLAPDYLAWMAATKIRPERAAEVDAVADKLLRFQAQGRYTAVSVATGVPEAWMAASFEREASSDFARSPAQGDRWDRPSVNVPKNRGPFNSWDEAARDAYHIDGLDKVGTQNWTWVVACYYGELFNGFGYRDGHGLPSPYLFGATNIQKPGKYIADHVFRTTDDAGRPLFDQQIGIVPLMMRMAEKRPALTMVGSWPFPEPTASVIAPSIVPVPSPTAAFDVKAIQRVLNAKGFGPLMVDGSFGRKSSGALRAFEQSVGLTADGIMDKATVNRLLAA